MYCNNNNYYQTQLGTCYVLIVCLFLRDTNKTMVLQNKRLLQVLYKYLTNYINIVNKKITGISLWQDSYNALCRRPPILVTGARRIFVCLCKVVPRAYLDFTLRCIKKQQLELIGSCQETMIICDEQACVSDHLRRDNLLRLLGMLGCCARGRRTRCHSAVRGFHSKVTFGRGSFFIGTMTKKRFSFLFDHL